MLAPVGDAIRIIDRMISSYNAANSGIELIEELEKMKKEIENEMDK